MYNPSPFLLRRQPSQLNRSREISNKISRPETQMRELALTFQKRTSQIADISRIVPVYRRDWSTLLPICFLPSGFRSTPIYLYLTNGLGFWIRINDSTYTIPVTLSKLGFVRNIKVNNNSIRGSSQVIKFINPLLHRIRGPAVRYSQHDDISSRRQILASFADWMACPQQQAQFLLGCLTLLHAGRE